MLAFLDYENDDLCPSCGSLKEECQAKENEFAFEPFSMRCHITHTREVAKDQFAAAKYNDMRGLMIGVRRRGES